MSLSEKLIEDMKTAMKSKDSVRVGVIRMVRAELQKAEISQKGELKSDDELAVLSRQAKQRRESIEAYEQAGRTELADKEKAELAVLEAYLPKQMTREEVVAIAKELIASTGASSKSEMGKVMGQLMPKLKGRFPGKDVKPIVEELLG
ncbi:MAG: GatB/YqeY domain-containing protein [Myxococcota bacterium]|nr:GatB/YqeY domain-containing protein [Myxococcota bacterium]